MNSIKVLENRLLRWKVIYFLFMITCLIVVLFFNGCTEEITNPIEKVYLQDTTFVYRDTTIIINYDTTFIFIYDTTINNYDTTIVIIIDTNIVVIDTTIVLSLGDTSVVFNSGNAPNNPIYFLYLEPGMNYLLEFTGTVVVQREDNSFDFNDCFFYWDYWNGPHNHSNTVLLNNQSMTNNFQPADDSEYEYEFLGDGILSIKCNYNFEILRNSIEYRWMYGEFRVTAHPQFN